MRAYRSQFCYISNGQPGLTIAKEHGGKKKGEGKKEQFHNNKF